MTGRFGNLMRRAGVRAGVVAGLALMLAGVGGAARGGDVYTVRNVAVDATASNAALARERALNEGHGKALALVLRRLALPEDWDRLPKPEPEQARVLAVSFGVLEEKLAPTRYIGRISVRFDPSRVRTLLESSRLSFTELQGRPVLIVPVWQRDKQAPVIWRVNPWRAVWEGLDLANAPVPFVLPTGDVSDIAEARPAAVLADSGAVAKLRERYRQDDVLVAHGQAAEEGGWVAVTLAFHSGGGIDRASFFLTGDDEDVLLAKAARRILDMFAGPLKRRTVVRQGEKGALRVRARFDSFNDWLGLTTRLERVPTLEAWRIRALTDRDATLEVRFLGSPKTFAAALREHGLVFREGENTTSWTLRVLQTKTAADG